jgi:hypothetical protein
MATDGGFEHATDLDAKGERHPMTAKLVLLSILAMVVLGLLVHYSVVGLLDVFLRHYSALDTKPSPIMTGQARKLPPEPRLQSNPVGDLRKLQQNEDDILQTYGWVDQNAGIVRIPVARALELVAARGLPAVSAPASPSQPSGGKRAATPTTKAAPETKTTAQRSRT